MLVALVGVVGVGNLVFDELRQGEICPPLLGVPACYLIMICILLVLVSQLGIARDRNRLFFLGAGAAWLVAVVASVLQLAGEVECPKTSSGTPLCYLSLILFSVLWALKIGELGAAKRS